MIEFASLKPKVYSYLTDDNDENNKKKQKATKSVSYNENLKLKIIRKKQIE